MKVALDLDDVLRPFLAPLTEFFNERYAGRGEFLRVEDWRQLAATRNFADVWGGTLADAIRIVKEFYEIEVFQNIEPAEGSRELVEYLLSREVEVVIVTSCHDIQSRTIVWIQRWFPQISPENIYFTGEFEGVYISKLDVCERLGVSMLIDDSLTHLIRCAENGIIPVWLALGGMSEDDTAVVQDQDVEIVREIGAVREIIEGRIVRGIEMGY